MRRNGVGGGLIYPLPKVGGGRPRRVQPFQSPPLVPTLSGHQVKGCKLKENMDVITTCYSYLFALLGSFCPLGILAKKIGTNVPVEQKNWVRGSGREITTFYLSASMCVCVVCGLGCGFPFSFVGVWPPPAPKTGRGHMPYACITHRSRRISEYQL